MQEQNSPSTYIFLLYKADQIVFYLTDFAEALGIAMRDQLRLVRLRLGQGGIVLGNMIVFDPS